MSVATINFKTGDRVSVQHETGTFYDATITAITKKMATVLFDDDETGTYPVSDLEAPLKPAVQDRMMMLEKLTRLIAERKLNSLVVTGQAGIGKTVSVTSVLDDLGLVEDEDYVIVKGHSTPFSLYKTLYDFQERLILFDDCDSVFDSEIGANILKAVLDTTGKRKVTWKTTERVLGDYPDTFEFHGQVIFISNLTLEDLPAAVLSRSVMVDIWLDNDEVVDLMELRCDAIREKIGASKTDAKEVMALITKYRNTIPVLSLRTLVLGLTTYTRTQDMQLTRYQILRNS